ncbi:hypothetical protein [Acidisarcina polymorpha]|uniref:hypothetical protein n=1 Tax=Acidisarcina polymorpha TaxID=2211140 RepID=UPI000DEF7E74|nr:hypothetical protein [Acidisarcina polymorpha]
MTSEQLLATRATLWRQKGDPLLTLDDAQSWLLQSGLCLFLPRKAQISAPAPSFVEACLGETNPTPPRKAIETAKELLIRLIEANAALPLNLLGTSVDHPDFLVSIEALPFVYALRGDRDWKHAPGTAGANRVSPLIAEVWKLLERRGVLTATEIQEELGRELTEAAVIRALHELWSSLRVVPLYQPGGQETLWEPLQSRYQKAINSGAGMSQVTALSVLVSVYLQSVVASSSDDAESFLSPLASRSKVREVVRGLTATRQLALIQMETHSLLHVEGSLPEFAEAEKPPMVEGAAQVVRRQHPTSPEGLQASLSRRTGGSTTRPPYKRPSPPSHDRPSVAREPGAVSERVRPAASGHSAPRKRENSSSSRPGTGGSRPAFRPKTSSSFSKASSVERTEPGSGLRPDGTPKKARWRDLPGGRPDQKGKPARFGPRKAEASTSEGREPRPPRQETASFRRPADARSSAARPPYRSAGTRPPFKSSGPPRASGTGRPAGGFRPSSGPRSDRPSYGGTKSREVGSREGGNQPPSRSTDTRFGGRPPARSAGGSSGTRPEGTRPYPRPPRADGSPVGGAPRDRAASGDRKFIPRPPRGGEFRASRPSTGESRPFKPRPSGPGGRPPYGRPASDRPSTDRPRPGGPSAYRGSGPSGRSATGRPASGRSFAGKPGGSKFGGPSSSGGRPSGSGFKPDYKPRGSKPGGSSGTRTGARPGFGQGPRPGSSAGRPFSKPRAGGPSKFKKRPEPSA